MISMGRMGVVKRVAMACALASAGCASSMTPYADGTRADPAIDGGRFGLVEMECQWLQGGGLTRCLVISESPRGRDLGQATLDRMQMVRVSRDDPGMAPPAERVRFTMRVPLTSAGQP